MNELFDVVNIAFGSVIRVEIIMCDFIVQRRNVGLQMPHLVRLSCVILRSQ